MNWFIKGRKKALVGGLIIGMTAIAGCLKKSDVQFPDAEVKTYISVMHLAPDGPAVELYINNNRETNPLLPGAVFQYYAGTNPGPLELKFKRALSDSIVASLPVSYYDSLRFYSVILYNDPQNVRAVRAIKIQDDFSGMMSDKSSIRFLNMSPELGVNFYIDNELVSRSRTNADFAGRDSLRYFQAYTPGTYTIRAKLTGTDSVLAKASAQLTSGNAYTIFLQGSPKNTVSSSLKLVVLRATN